MSEAKVGPEFITHELDEAISIQQTIVDAEQQLAESHPEEEAKRVLRGALKEDEKFLKQLRTLGEEHGATGKAEEVAGALQQLMEQTARKASEAESEAYEAHAVLLTLKRKQQDSASAMVKIAREMQDTKLRDAADEMHKAMKTGAQELADQLAVLAVRISSQGQPSAGA